MNFGVASSPRAPARSIDPWLLGSLDENDVQGYAGTPVERELVHVRLRARRRRGRRRLPAAEDATTSRSTRRRSRTSTGSRRRPVPAPLVGERRHAAGRIARDATRRRRAPDAGRRIHDPQPKPRSESGVDPTRSCSPTGACCSRRSAVRLGERPRRVRHADAGAAAPGQGRAGARSPPPTSRSRRTSSRRAARSCRTRPSRACTIRGTPARRRRGSTRARHACLRPEASSSSPPARPAR